MTLEVPSGQHSEVRLDVYITGFVQNATRSKVQQAIKEGYVTVNQKREKSSYIVEAGDRIEIDLPKPPPKEAQPEAMDLDIRYEDEDLLVVLKPAGMVVHPAFGNWEGTLVNGLLHHTGGQDGLAQQARDAIRPGIVHRLDKDTSGLLVVAKHDHALSELSKQFA
ncbi:MAG TPA: RNA pseudouridine synthase, partial [Bacteroidetes bacterium]|nr:RNA pseudouridine synthase [Bacteroidota bacterium]